MHAPLPTTTDPGHLITGWEHDLAAGDTLLRHYVLALGASVTGPAVAMDGRILERDEVVAADLGRPAGIGNAAVLTQPPAPDRWSGPLGAVEAFFASGTGRAYVFSPWPAPDLSRSGWELEGHPPLLVRPPGLALPDAPGDLEIREVADADALDDLAHVLVEGFPFDEVAATGIEGWLDERLLGVPGHRLFVGYHDRTPVSAGWLYLYDGLGVLVLGATLPRYRGRGYWTAMLRARLSAAGDRPVASLFGDMSRPIAERHGFLPVVRFTVWHRDR